MKTAITIWNDRISPVFDVARNLVILEIEGNVIKQKSLEIFPGDQPERKALRMKELGVNTLICGAISKYVARLISVHRIEIIPFISGETDVIIKAFLSGQLPNPRLMMPGCCRRLRKTPEN
ncbi:MAG: dinitrogenase iron-molybdenum cofactor biosynthesis domain-containing protein [Proteobacteria bacterium]|nr:dinitrogenase iron-molybdenum cofactor biosynthesis domain-containing protein [Pseudomonadota bacterium]